MIIEGLVPDPRRRASIRIQVGGRPVWTVPSDVSGAGPHRWCRPPGRAHGRLDRAADEEGAFRASLRALERRAHGRESSARSWSGKGIRRRRSRPHSRLLGLGLLDDAEFVCAYIRARAARGRGPVRLRHDLASSASRAISWNRRWPNSRRAGTTPRPRTCARRATAQVARRACQGGPAPAVRRLSGPSRLSRRGAPDHRAAPRRAAPLEAKHQSER